MNENSKEKVGLGTTIALLVLRLFGVKTPKPGKDYIPLEPKK